MQLSDFIEGETYALEEHAPKTPYAKELEDRMVIRKVLEPANAINSQFENSPVPDHVIVVWSKMLRVLNPTTNKIHLIDPGQIKSATKITTIQP